ncbi:hypothetical protein Tco_0674994 [Tanacetum coccineum]
MSRPEVIKVIREEAKKFGIDPKEAISTKAGETFRKAQDAEHEVLKREHSKKQYSRGLKVTRLHSLLPLLSKQKGLVWIMVGAYRLELCEEDMRRGSSRALRMSIEQSHNEIYGCLKGGSKSSKGKRLAISMVEEAWLSEKKDVLSKDKECFCRRERMFHRGERMFSSKRKNVSSKRNGERFN